MASFLSNMKKKIPKPKLPKRLSQTPTEDDEHDITPPIAEASRASQVMDDEDIDFTDAAVSSPIEVPQEMDEPREVPPEPARPPPAAAPQKRSLPKFNISRPKVPTLPKSERFSQRKSELFDIMQIKPEPTAQELAEQEANDEVTAMRQFQQNLHKYRTAYMYYTAPGFDYIQWKTYGTYRSNNGTREFYQQARALSDYVYAVVESGCKGAEEKRWVTLTTSPEQHSAFMEASRAASIAASKEQLTT